MSKNMTQCPWPLFHLGGQSDNHQASALINPIFHLSNQELVYNVLISVLEILCNMFTTVFTIVYKYPDLTNLQGKQTLVQKIGEFEKSGVNLQCLTDGSSNREVRKTEGSRNQDSTVV